MAKRRANRWIIKEYLNELGEKVYQQATETSRRYGKVQDEQNYKVQPDTVLTFGQMVYMRGTIPKGTKWRKERFQQR
jgi:hypothetical protein